MPAKPRICPSCQGWTEADGKSCSCGWRAPEAKPKKTSYARLCAWTELGQRCGKLGIISLSSNGEGEFYCRDHFADKMDWPHWDIPKPQEDMAVVDERVNKLVPRKPGEPEHDWSMRCRDYMLAFVQGAQKPPSKAWAHKIMARTNAGESVSLTAEGMANDVVNAAPAREPGDD